MQTQILVPCNKVGSYCAFFAPLRLNIFFMLCRKIAVDKFQIKNEMAGALDFLSAVYGVFGFSFDLKLSTRPEKFLGEVEVWNHAEQQLKESLDAFGQKWEYNHGDGAFYGPKVMVSSHCQWRRQVYKTQWEYVLSLCSNNTSKQCKVIGLGLSLGHFQCDYTISL